MTLYKVVPASKHLPLSAWGISAYFGMAVHQGQ